MNQITIATKELEQAWQNFDFATTEKEFNEANTRINYLNARIARIMEEKKNEN